LNNSLVALLSSLNVAGITFPENHPYFDNNNNYSTQATDLFGSGQDKLFEYKKKHFKNSPFLSLQRYFCYQEGRYNKYGSARIGLKRSFRHQKGGSKA